jgi:hypothetical protein
MDPQQVYVPETSWTATIALIIALLALIIIIVVAIFAFRDITDVADLVNFWTVVNGTAVATESFTASPNNIYRASSSLTAPITVNIVGYPAIATTLVNSRTTMFKIDNTGTNQIVNVTFTGGTFVANPTNTTFPIVVAPGTTATYIFASATQVERLS